jgi:hypothetical protein
MALTSAALSAFPPIAHSPLATSYTRTQVTPRIASPSTSTGVRDLVDHRLLLAFVEHAFDKMDINEWHGSFLSWLAVARELIP